MLGASPPAARPAMNSTIPARNGPAGPRRSASRPPATMPPRTSGGQRSLTMADRRCFRFGVVGEGIGTARQLADRARRAEELGYATLLLRDHFVREPFGDQLAPLVALTAAAAA